jgi:hypothetical protein
MSLKVTRKPGVPGGEAGCTVKVSDSLTVKQSALDNPPLTYQWAYSETTKKKKFVAGQPYDLYSNEAGYGLNHSVKVPALPPGESFTIPLSFQPNIWESGWKIYGQVSYDDYQQAWGLLYVIGDLHLSTWGCGTDELDVEADGKYGSN